MDEALTKNESVKLEALASRLGLSDAQKLVDNSREEFNVVTSVTPGFDNFRQNAAKNRYHGNIYLYDHTRVVLRDSTKDYIHASYISTPKHRRRFILTQAPLPETIDDFWLMIAQERIQVLVALCQFDEPGEQSDDPFPKYWPQNNGQTQKYGKVRVTNVESRVSPSLAITRLQWTKAERSWGMVHLHLKSSAWEQSGTPTINLQELIDSTWAQEEQMAKANNCKDARPIVIHCGSGTARSGQFCAFAMVTEALRQGWQFSLKDIICSLQSQRYGVLRELSRVTALCYAVIEYGKRNELLRGVNTDPILRQLKERLSST